MSALKNAKHERFAQLVAGGKPQADAYVEAGFQCEAKAAEASASRLRARPDVDARIRELQGAAAERTSKSIVDCVEELAKLGFSNMKRFRDFAFTGDLDALEDVDAAALRSVTVESYVEPAGADDSQEPQGRGGSLKRSRAKGREVKRVKFEIHDKRGPLTDIIRHLGGFRPGRGESLPGGEGGGDDVPSAGTSELDLARRIAFALELAARRREEAVAMPVKGKPTKGKRISK